MLRILSIEFELKIIPFFSENKFSPLSGSKLGSPDPEADDIPMCHHVSLNTALLYSLIDMKKVDCFSTI